MQFSILIVAAASMASATVYQGLRTGVDGSTSQVAWTNGTPDPCSGFSTIVQGGGAPCWRDFYVDGNNGPFRLQNCGTGNPVLDRNGAFNAGCTYKPRTFKCSNSKIEQKWQC
ncbi:hypothetical protein PG987_000770 [Apiospora arundinis]